MISDNQKVQANMLWMYGRKRAMVEMEKVKSRKSRSMRSETTEDKFEQLAEEHEGLQRESAFTAGPPSKRLSSVQCQSLKSSANC